jgi:hypothetical protein
MASIASKFARTDIARQPPSEFIQLDRIFYLMEFYPKTFPNQTILLENDVF